MKRHNTKYSLRFCISYVKYYTNVEYVFGDTKV